VTNTATNPPMPFPFSAVEEAPAAAQAREGLAGWRKRPVAEKSNAQTDVRGGLCGMPT
jgi:hypothetical protein